MRVKFNKIKVKMIMAAVMAVMMILQPVTVFAAAVESTTAPEVIEEAVAEQITAAEDLSLPQLTEMNALSQTKALGWMDEAKSGEAFDIKQKMILNLYNDPAQVSMQRLILQNTIIVDLAAAEKAGIQITEVENAYSAVENFKEYEIKIITDKKAQVFPLELEIAEIKEGTTAAVIGGNTEGQWIKAEIINNDNKFEILDKAEGAILDEGKTLAQIEAEEKAAAEKAIQEAYEKAMAEQKALEEQQALEAKAAEEKAAAEQAEAERIAAEQKALEEQVAIDAAKAAEEKAALEAAKETETTSPEAPVVLNKETTTTDGTTTTLESGIEAIVPEIQNKEEALIIPENLTDNIDPVVEENKAVEETTPIETSVIFITTLEKGTETGIAGAEYELTNIKDANSKYFLKAEESMGNMTDIPYGEYSIKQIATAEGYSIAAEIPNLIVNEYKEGIVVENAKIEPEVLLAPIAMTEPVTAPTTIEELALQSLQMTAASINESAQQFSTIYITTSQSGSPDITIEGAIYELQNVEYPALVYQTKPSGIDGVTTIEVPYGNYKITQLASAFGYSNAVTIPDLQVNEEKEGIAVENEIIPLDLTAKTVEEPIFRSMSLASLSTLNMAPMAVTNPDGSKTETGSGNLVYNNHTYGDFTWTATAAADGSYVDWSVTVNKTTKSYGASARLQFERLCKILCMSILLVKVQ